MKKALYVIGTFILAVIIVFIFTHSSNKIPIKQQLKKLDLSNIDKVMVVAHPDDESIWGGAHLMKDNYLVVCVTCGTNKVRVNEIRKAMEYTNDELIMLDYPDKVWGQRSDWKNEKKQITKDIKTILKYKDWTQVVTHNPDGEYGHEQHKMTSKIVTNIYGINDNLYYFGKYYTKKTLNKLDKETTIEAKTLKDKTKNLLPIYKSQNFIDKKFGHMYPYEDWVKSTDWS